MSKTGSKYIRIPDRCSADSRTRSVFSTLGRVPCSTFTSVSTEKATPGFIRSPQHYLLRRREDVQAGGTHHLSRPSLVPREGEKKRGMVLEERSRPKLTCGCGRGPTARNFVRNASVCSAAPINSRKAKNGPWIQLVRTGLSGPRFVCDFLVPSCTSNCQQAISEDSARKDETLASPYSSPLDGIIYGGNPLTFSISQASTRSQSNIEHL
ncbi:hypothetical protein BJ322DRAFT_443325 [Thelephora terrestris]|uniref:Uncharacterized protein n=1 Tax=Thelephora terrestris TaxID=56493 RepID=A0A9P6H6F3_9AGAM|nr:hypothetical protein BJ322DRAFT_443325 [Thelephora terrestris]